jgi:hypothetical protein
VRVRTDVVYRTWWCKKRQDEYRQGEIVASEKLVEIAKRGRAAIGKWRQANPDKLLNLSDADLSGANLRGANLKRADLTGANLQGADLIGTQFAEAELTRADLRGAKLVKADLYTTKLFKATLAYTDCSGAYFRRADLTQADLSNANLTKADFIETNLTNSSIKNANLIGADISGATMIGVDVRGATFGWTKLCQLNLTQLVGIEQIKHVGPSTLGIDTALLSHEKIEPEFLQGCGIAEGVVANWKELFSHPLQQLPCFVRFAPDDSSFAKHVVKRGQEKGLRCWLDEMPDKADGRKKAASPLTYETNERILFCASKASLTSWWANDEIERILEREEQAKKNTKDVRFFYPINLDGFMFSGDWKHPREKQIAKASIDFVGWRRNQEKFDQELGKLIQVMSGEK